MNIHKEKEIIALYNSSKMKNLMPHSRRPDSPIIEEEIKRRELKVLYHATYSAFVPFMFISGGLYSRKSLKFEPRTILSHSTESTHTTHNFSDDYICVSLEPHWKYIYTNLFELTNDSICILEISPTVLCYENVLFITKYFKNLTAIVRNKTSINDFQALFENKNSKKPCNRISTVYIPDHIPTRDIIGIVYPTEQERMQYRKISLKLPSFIEPRTQTALFPDKMCSYSKKGNWRTTHQSVMRILERLGYTI